LLVRIAALVAVDAPSVSYLLNLKVARRAPDLTPAGSGCPCCDRTDRRNRANRVCHRRPHRRGTRRRNRDRRARRRRTIRTSNSRVHREPPLRPWLSVTLQNHTTHHRGMK
jgi:hypothetical protein